MNTLVIARYAENLDWLAALPEGYALHIVNKGAPIANPAVIERATSIVERPNRGRESETYLSYMLEGDHAGDGHTVFAQGDPFEHSPDFLALLALNDEWAPVQPLSWSWRAGRAIPPAIVLQREQAGFLGGLRLRPEYFSLATWSPPSFSDPGTQWLEETYRKIHRLAPGSNIAAHFLASCGLTALAAEAERHVLGRFAYGAVFAVRNATLRELDRKALVLMRRAALSHQVYGYVLERLWLHLCGESFVLPALTNDIATTLPDAPPGLFVPPDTRSPRRQKVERIARRVQHMFARA